jgi:hypothetical protein
MRWERHWTLKDLTDVGRGKTGLGFEVLGAVHVCPAPVEADKIGKGVSPGSFHMDMVQVLGEPREPAQDTFSGGEKLHIHRSAVVRTLLAATYVS